MTTAVIVGTVLFVINHLVEVLDGNATTGVWISTGISFVVPFCVANVGLLFASRRRPQASGQRGPAPAPTWRTPAEGWRCVTHRPHLRRTLTTALIVGSLYFLVNQSSKVMGGHATAATWIAVGLSYLVPFCVSNVGLLVGCRDESAPGSC